MEAFRLLKYWRGGSEGRVVTADATIVHQSAAVSPESSNGEEGTCFDLEFALPEDETDTEEEEQSSKTTNGNETESGSENGDEDEEGEVNISLTSDQNHEELAVASSEEILLRGDFVSVEPADVILNDSEENSRFPVFLLKSATKFRVLLLKLKKSKSVNGILEKPVKMEKNESNGHDNSSPLQGEVKQSALSGKFLTVMCKAEEVRMPLLSLFIRDNSSNSKHNGKCTKNNQEDSDSTALSEERKWTKEVVQKYIKMVKPLYIRVSKRYVDKLKFSGQLNFPAGASKRGGGPGSLPAEKAGETAKKAATPAGSMNNNLQAGLKVVRMHLGKSWSASAVVKSPPQPGKTASSRRDDSLLEIHDGIQGAILHCKKSFNATKDVESSVLSRSVSDPSYEKYSCSSFSGKDQLEL